MPAVGGIFLLCCPAPVLNAVNGPLSCETVRLAGAGPLCYPEAPMFDRIKALFAAEAEAAAPAFDDVEFAAAALLVVAARQDGVFDDTERARIEALLMEHFGLGREEAQTLIAEAAARAEDSVQILPFTRVIKDRFTPEQRVEMVEMLWEVVYADGVLNDHEATLMRRIGGLVYVSDRERGEARKRVLRKLKAAGKPA